MPGQRGREDHIGRANAGVGFNRQPHPKGDGDRDQIAEQRVDGRRLARKPGQDRAAQGRRQHRAEHQRARILKPPPRKQRSPQLDRRVMAHRSKAPGVGSQRPAVDCRAQLPFAPHTLEIGERSTAIDHLFKILGREVRGIRHGRPRRRQGHNASRRDRPLRGRIRARPRPDRPAGRRRRRCGRGHAAASTRSNTRLFLKSGTSSLNVSPSTSALPDLPSSRSCSASAIHVPMPSLISRPERMTCG